MGWAPWAELLLKAYRFLCWELVQWRAISKRMVDQCGEREALFRTCTQTQATQALRKHHRDWSHFPPNPTPNLDISKADSPLSHKDLHTILSLSSTTLIINICNKKWSRYTHTKCEQLRVQGACLFQTQAEYLHQMFPDGKCVRIKSLKSWMNLLRRTCSLWKSISSNRKCSQPLWERKETCPALLKDVPENLSCSFAEHTAEWREIMDHCNHLEPLDGQHIVLEKDLPLGVGVRHATCLQLREPCQLWQELLPQDPLGAGAD